MRSLSTGVVAGVRHESGLYEGKRRHFIGTPKTFCSSSRVTGSGGPKN